MHTCFVPVMCLHSRVASLVESMLPKHLHSSQVVQVQALEGLGQENSRLAASNEAIVKHLSGSASLSVSLAVPLYARHTCKHVLSALQTDQTLPCSRGTRYLALRVGQAGSDGSRLGM